LSWTYDIQENVKLGHLDMIWQTGAGRQTKEIALEGFLILAAMDNSVATANWQQRLQNKAQNIN
jgi:hypothetical protein